MEETEAWEDAEVERFLRNGMLVSNLDICGGDDEGEVAGDVYADDIEEEEEEEEDRDDPDWLSDWVFSNEVSEPVCDKFGPCPRCISPKYLSVNFKASSWLTPAKATTILSGR